MAPTGRGRAKTGCGGGATRKLRSTGVVDSRGQDSGNWVDVDRPESSNPASVAHDASGLAATVSELLDRLSLRRPAEPGREAASYQLDSTRINVFTGFATDQTAWRTLTDVEHACVNSGMNEAQFVNRYAMRFVSDIALRWVKNNLPFSSLHDFRVKFSEKFLTDSNDDIVFETILATRQGEGQTVAQFVDRMQQLFMELQAPLTEKDEIKYVFRNMLPHVKRALIGVEFKSVRHLVQLTERLELVDRQEFGEKYLSRPIEGVERASAKGSFNVTRGEAVEQSNAGRPRGRASWRDSAGTSSVPGAGDARRHKLREPPRCFGCGSTQHLVRHCAAQSKSGNEVGRRQ